jgi:hypothetical protein
LGKQINKAVFTLLNEKVLWKIENICVFSVFNDNILCKKDNLGEGGLSSIIYFVKIYFKRLLQFFIDLF